MHADSLAGPAGTIMTPFRAPQSVLARFVGRSVSKTAVIVGYAFAAYVASSILGFVKTYNTASSRAALAASFGGNPGLDALLGTSRRIETVRGFAAWRTLGVLTIVGAIWALSAATKRFRGEEEAGRLELFLSGQTTGAGAAVNTLAGLGMGLLIIYVLSALATLVVGNLYGIHLHVGESLFFAVALVAGIAEFFAVGALASQVAATRRRAAGIAAVVFGACFLMRAIGDAAPSAHWLTDISPLGWIENLRPLTGSSPGWLLPIAGFVALLCVLAVRLAGSRDLGASLVPDRESAKPRTRLLNSPFGLAVREVRWSLVAWLVALAASGLSMGAIAKSAGKALAASPSIAKYFSNVTQSQRIAFGTVTYLGVIMLVLMAVVMALAASAIGAMREEEAEGYLENLVVRPVSRKRWLGGRLIIAVVTILLGSTVAGVFTWLGAATQHSGVSFGKMCTAGLNVAIPAAFILGLGMLTLGTKPRWTTAVPYTVIAWSFLLEMVGPVIHLNHWVLDTSLLHHVALSPAADPHWGTGAVIVGLAVAACVMGAVLFNRRDLAGK